MKMMAKLWESMMAKRAMSIVLCGALSVTATGICAATTSDLAEETARAREAAVAVEETAGGDIYQEGEASSRSQVSTKRLEGIPLEDDTGAQEEPEVEDTRCIHTFTQAWVGYECRLTDYVSGYEPGDEVRIQAVFNKQVGSQFGMYIDGVWNAFAGEGKTRNITLIPDSDYLNIQITDLKGLDSVNLADISVEISKKGQADSGSYLHRFTGLWQGFETKFSDYNPEYEPGDEVKVTVVYSKKVTSQIGMNIGGAWTTESGEGRELVKTITPDNDYLNIQISDMWASYSVGIVSVSVEITRKGPGVSSYGGGGLTTRNYTEPGDYLLFSGEANESYYCNDAWILYCADTDYLTLTYTCAPEHENWGVLGWQATLDGEWTNGPSYSADAGDSTREVSQTFSVRYLRKMMGITGETSVGSLSLGAWSEGRIRDLTLHVGSEIPRDTHLFQNGAPNQAWVCTDIERILDLPDEKYICLQYTCATPDYEGWTIMTWGASVNGEWRNGKSYKTSTREATRYHFDSMRMDAFRNMLHLSWDNKVDSITLNTYNDGRILDIWISDTKVEDPGNSKKDKVNRESGYSSGNGGLWNRVEGTEGEVYEQNISLNGWEWASGDKSLKGEDRIINGLREQTYLVVEYTPEDAAAPNLQFTMWDGKQKQIVPSDAGDGRAIFAYKDIAAELSDYLIPQEIKNLQVSASEDTITLKKIRVVKDESDPRDVPIAVFTRSWEGFGTEISKWHSEYQVGDTVKVTVTFDKRAPGYIAYNASADNWDRGPEMYGQVISRTVKPYNDHLDISIAAMPENARKVIVEDIRIEIAGKTNFKDYVVVEGGGNIGRLAGTPREAVTAALTDAEIRAGMKLVLTMEKTDVSPEEEAAVKSVFGDQAENVHTAFTMDINAYKENAKGERTRITDTMSPIPLKITVPRDLEGKGNDFAMVREHEGNYEFLEDRDGNPDTVTFRTDAFSGFTMVYGEPGAFDGISGAVKSFRSEWDTFNTSFSTYFERYQPGKPATVTLTFEKPVKAYVDYNAPDWTRAEGSGVSTTFTTTVIPTDDSLGIGIADINGNSKVKLLSVKVEQEVEKIYGFSATGQVFETTFDTYNQAFVPGIPAKVTLTFDNAVVSSMGYNGPDEMTVAGTSPAKVLSATITPEDRNLRIWLTSLCGNRTANLLDVTVEQDFSSYEVIHTYRSTYTGMEEDRKITDYYQEFQPGDKVKVTLIFDRKVQSGLVYYNPEWTRDEGSVSSTSLTKTVVPETDAWNAQIVDLCGNEAVSLLYVYMEPVEAEPLYTFTSTESTFRSAFDQYDQTFVAGRETTVALTFDQPVKAQIRYKGADGETVVESTGYSETLTATITPADKTMEIRITDMNGNPVVKLADVSVEQKGDFLYEFTKTWGADNNSYENSFSYFNPDFQTGLETEVTLTFDKAVKVKLMYDSTDVGSDDSQCSTVITKTITPAADRMTVQIADLNGNAGVRLLSVEVKQKKQPEALHEFTKPWDGFETSFEAYNDQFRSGEETVVTLTFDRQVKAQIGYNAETGYTNTEGTEAATDLTRTIIPANGYMNIQIMDMNGNSMVKLLDVSVEQGERPVATIRKEDSDKSYCIKVSELCAGYQAGDKVTVTAEMRSDGRFNGGLAGNVAGASPAWVSNQAEFTSDLNNQAAVSWNYVPDGDCYVQIWGMDGTKVDITSVKVEKGDVQEPIGTITGTGDDGTYVIEISKLCPEYQAGDTVTVTAEMSSDGYFNGRLGGNVKDTGWSQQEFASENNQARITWTYVPDGDCSIQMWYLGGTKVEIDKLSVEKAAATLNLADGLIMEEPIHTFHTPGLYTLDLEEQNGLNLEDGNVNLEITLVSLAPFEAMVEKHDQEKEDVPKASPSDASPLCASPSNAQPGPGMPVAENSDEDDILVLKWKGIPESGKLDITVSGLTEGAPVYIEHVEAVTREEEDSPESEGGAGDSGSIGTQQPARKEDEVKVPGTDDDPEEPAGDGPGEDETPEKGESTADSVLSGAADNGGSGQEGEGSFGEDSTGGAETDPSGDEEAADREDTSGGEDSAGDSSDTSGGEDSAGDSSDTSGGEDSAGDSSDTSGGEDSAGSSN